jgi:hypothetical protein
MFFDAGSAVEQRIRINCPKTALFAIRHEAPDPGGIQAIRTFEAHAGAS